MNFSDIFSSIVIAFQQTSSIEWLIFSTALLYILLVAFENSWGWFFGIVASVLSVYLCYTGKLFLESGLNVFYVIIGFYGWYQWLYGSNEKKEISIRSLSFSKNILFLFIGALVWIPFGYIAHRFSTQVLPYLDAFITAFSIIATWMTAKKIIENWLYWIAIDTLGIVLFSYRGFHLLAVLNIIYTLMAVAGYISWRKKIISSSELHS
jgi:nicotinamide mononucleotide transporter